MPACLYVEKVLQSSLTHPGLVPTLAPVSLTQPVLQLPLQLRRAGANIPVWSSHVPKKPGCVGWAFILNKLLITLRRFL